MAMLTFNWGTVKDTSDGVSFTLVRNLKFELLSIIVTSAAEYMAGKPTNIANLPNPARKALFRGPDPARGQAWLCLEWDPPKFPLTTRSVLKISQGISRCGWAGWIPSTTPTILGCVEAKELADAIRAVAKPRRRTSAVPSARPVAVP